MPSLQFEVDHSCFSASGGSFLVQYSARVELTENPDVVQVNVASLRWELSGSQKMALQEAIASTRLGFMQVLAGTGFGADAELSDLAIHPVDFKPTQQQHFSEVCFREALVEAGLIQPPA